MVMNRWRQETNIQGKQFVFHLLLWLFENPSNHQLVRGPFSLPPQRFDEQLHFRREFGAALHGKLVMPQSRQPTHAGWLRSLHE